MLFGLRFEVKKWLNEVKKQSNWNSLVVQRASPLGQSPFQKASLVKDMIFVHSHQAVTAHAMKVFQIVNPTINFHLLPANGAFFGFKFIS